MIAFPPASDLSFLIDQTLDQISFAPFSTQFHFEKSRLISELAVQQLEPDGSIWDYKCVAGEASPSMLHRLVGKRVVNVSTEPMQLTISFEGGSELRVMTDLGPYEAGHIDGEGKFVVF
jgi:hypothetical protein